MAQIGERGRVLVLQSSDDPLAMSVGWAGRGWPEAFVVAGGDCVEPQPDRYLRVSLSGPRTPAEVATAAAVSAPLRACTRRRGSLAARRISAVDPSFTQLREPPVTFSGEDVVTRLRGGLLVRPWYQAAPEDPREGLRVAVEDLAGGGRRVIARDCAGAEVARSATHIAIACVVEQVAEQPVFRTTLYRAGDLATLRVVPRCRRPALEAAGLICSEQVIGRDGRISESTRRVAL